MNLFQFFPQDRTVFFGLQLNRFAKSRNCLVGLIIFCIQDAYFVKVWLNAGRIFSRQVRNSGLAGI